MPAPEMVASKLDGRQVDEKSLPASAANKPPQVDTTADGNVDKNTEEAMVTDQEQEGGGGDSKDENDDLAEKLKKLEEEEEALRVKRENLRKLAGGKKS